jgi:MinD-like ATPase involved in chromosome partitioning or flagellar assembly
MDDKKPYIILLASQKGGVGKTAVALNLSVALACRRYKVLLVDGDLESASASEQLGIKSSGSGYMDVVNGNVPIDDAVFAYEPVDLYIIPSSPAEDIGDVDQDKLVGFYDKLTKLNYDFIIIDGQPGLFFKKVAKFLSDVAILTTPDPVSSKTSSEMAAYCEKLKLDHRLIINRIGMSKYDLDKDAIESLYGDVIFKMIPEDKIVEESLLKRKPAYLIDRRSDFSIAIEEIARDYLLKVDKGFAESDELEERSTPQGFFERLGKLFFP